MVSGHNTAIVHTVSPCSVFINMGVIDGQSHNNCNSNNNNSNNNNSMNDNSKKNNSNNNLVYVDDLRLNKIVELCRPGVHLSVSCSSLVDRCGSHGSCKPQI